MFEPGQVWFGITANCWNNDDLPALGADIPYRQVLSEMALAGYEGCSIGWKFPRDPAALRPELELRGLRISEPWVSTFFTCRDMREQTVAGFRSQVEFLTAMGGRDIVVAELGHSVHQEPVALLPNKPVFDDAQWRALTGGLDELGRIAAGAGLRLCYHHHMGTGVQTRAEVDRMLAGTDPALVHLLLDTGHLAWAGDDPLALARDHADRIAHVHLKDLRAEVVRDSARLGRGFLDSVAAGVFTVPGDGTIDFPPILRELAARGYGGWLMVEAEQDPAAADPLAYAIRGRDYLRKVTGL